MIPYPFFYFFIGECKLKIIVFVIAHAYTSIMYFFHTKWLRNIWSKEVEEQKHYLSRLYTPLRQQFFPFILSCQEARLQHLINRKTNCYVILKFIELELFIRTCRVLQTIDQAFFINRITLD